MAISQEESTETKTEKAKKLTPDACHECIDVYNYDPQHPERNPHNITWDDAKTMMSAFNNELLDATFYGGTIYGDETFFKSFANGSSSNPNVLKFHFCSLGEDSKHIFLAFEYGFCDAQYGLDLNVIADNLCISLDTSFRFKPLRNETEIKAPSIDLSNDANLNIQRKSKVDIERYKENLRNNKYFIDHLGTCLLPQSTTERKIALTGSFNFDASVIDIFRIAVARHKECKGIRYYFGYDSTSPTGNYIRVILVGVDGLGRNIPGTSKENSRPTKLRPIKNP